jgi:dipeptidyl aminopeptidase/acylaminoacyl peptidase
VFDAATTTRTVRSLGLAFALCACAGNAPADDVLRSLTAEDVLNITWAVRPELSPDGSRVLYTVIETKDGKRATTHWLSAVAEGASPERILAGQKGASHLRWSPDGRRLAFLESDPEAGKGKQLFVANADASGSGRLTAMPNGVVDYQWSADSAELAFTADERPQEPATIVVAGSDAPQTALWTIGLDDAEPRKITSDDQHVVDFAWSPDGKQFAVLAARSVPIDDVIYPTSLVIINRSDGSNVRVLAEHATGGCRIAWSPDGRTIAAPVQSPKKLSRRLALFSAEGGDPQFPFADFHATPVSRIEWSGDSRSLFVQFLEKTRNQLVRLDVQTGELTHVSDELTNFWDYAIDRDGTTFAFNAESQHDPPDIVVKRNGRLHRLTDFNRHLQEFRLGDVRTVEWKSSLDGRTIYGVLVTPAGYKAGARCPTVVDLHSGPQWLWWEGWIGTYLSWGQFLASNGYAVFLPNHRGSLGQGWEFTEAHYLEWGRGDYRDVMDGVDWLVDEGIADPERLAVGGTSFGAYLAAWTVTQTDRFKACVVEAGWSDLIFSNLTIDAPQPLRDYMNGSELDREELYRSRSPLTFVRQCRTPTLILHGQQDRRVPTDQGRAFYRALRLCGVESELVIYTNEGHGLSRRENQLDAMHRIKDWFDKHLMP